MLGLSILNSIEPKLEYLQATFCLDDEGLVTMVNKMPSLLGMSCTNIDKTLQFYSECYGKDKALQHTIGNPGLLTYSLKNRIIPRWKQAVELGFENEVQISVLAKHTNKQWALLMES